MIRLIYLDSHSIYVHAAQILAVFHFRSETCYSMNIGRYLTDNLMKLSADGGCFRLMTIVHELMHVLGKSKFTNKNKSMKLRIYM